MATRQEVTALMQQIEHLKRRLAWAERGHQFIGRIEDEVTTHAIARWEADEPEE